MNFGCIAGRFLVYKWTWLANSNFTVSTYGNSVLCIIFCFKVFKNKYAEQCSFTQLWKMCLLSYFSFSYGRVPVASSITVCWVQGRYAQRAPGQIWIQFQFYEGFSDGPSLQSSSGLKFYMWFQSLESHSFESWLERNFQPQTHISKPLLLLNGVRWLYLTRQREQKWCGCLLNLADFLSHFLSFSATWVHEALLDSCVNRWWKCHSQKTTNGRKLPTN